MNRALVKQQAKQTLRRVIGEPYVGKRLKIRNVSAAVRALDLRPLDIVDAGAEDATFVYWLADQYPAARVTAIDIDQAAMDACTAARPSRYADRVSFRRAFFSELPPSSVDLITAFDVLEHIENDMSAVADLFAALRPGGTLLAHVPRDRWTDRHGHVEVVPDSEAWKINPGHVRMGYSPESLTNLLESAGFEVVHTDLWLRRCGVLAHSWYSRVEHPTPLRILSVPFTDVMSVLDRRRPPDEGNTVWAVARKP